MTSSRIHATIPDVPLTQYVLRHAHRLGDKPAVIDGPTGRVLTYRQVSERVRRAAAGLAERGFGKGDVLAIHSPNVPEYVLAFLAAASLGGVITTSSPLSTADELTTQLQDSGARWLVTFPAGLDRAREAARRSRIGQVVAFGSAEGVTPFDALLDGGDQPPAVGIEPGEDLVALPYSSGTTGLPKGVMLTHRNVVANLSLFETAERFDAWTERDVVMGVLPFFHIYGLEVILLLGLASGSTIVCVPRFDLLELLGVIQQYRATILPLVPPILLGMIQHPAVAGLDLSSVRLVLSAAAPLGAEIAVALSARLGCPVIQGYGMTEASGATHLSPTRDASPRPGSVGLVAPNTEARIVGIGTEVDVPAGQPGEIWVRGPQIMKGYLRRPEETAACLDREGWYHTGDVGYVDDDGYLYIVDRTKELIKYKGHQVAPAELEALLLTHPAVLDTAVVRAPDREAGEVPRAYVVLKAHDGGGATTPDSIMSWVAERVAPHKRIRQVAFVDRIPKSASGKILRRVLMEAGAGRP
jgi:acyl-CoA synthetase (AMP-forming)/AMP-acid ligase II